MQSLRSALFPRLVTSNFVSKRFHVAYDFNPQSHADVTRTFANSKLSLTLEELLGRLVALESQVGSWNLNKWEIRTPPTLEGVERENFKAQLHLLRKQMIDQADIMAASNGDRNLVASILNMRPEDLDTKTRAWLQEQVARLRWEGKVNEAKDLREAWVRLEQYGSRDFRLLERMCTVYGMSRLNVFNNAFSNYLVTDHTGRVRLQREGTFQPAVEAIVSAYPLIDVCYEFLGFTGGAYHRGLRKYMIQLMKSKHNGNVSMGVGTRVLCTAAEGKEILFEMTPVPGETAQHGTGDFLYMNGASITLVSIANPSRHERQLQLPGRRQLEGIARRASLTLGVPANDVRIRLLYLPPNFMDSASLHRLHRAVGHTAPIDQLVEEGSVPAWAALYEKELDAAELDYMEVAKKYPEDEWVML